VSRYEKSAFYALITYIAVIAAVASREWVVIPAERFPIYFLAKALPIALAVPALMILRRNAFASIGHVLAGFSFSIYVVLNQWVRPVYLPALFQICTGYAFLFQVKPRVFLSFAFVTCAAFFAVTWLRFDAIASNRVNYGLQDEFMTILNYAIVAGLVYFFIFRERVLSERATGRFSLIGAHASSIIDDVKRLIVAPQVHVSSLKDSLRTNPNPQVQAHLEQLDESMSSASRLVMDLSEMVQFDAGRKETFSLAEVIGEVRTLLVNKLRGIDVVVRGDLLIEGERGLAYSVFLNLFMNALESLRSGGTAKAGARPTISIELEGKRCRFADNGQGFPPEMLKEITRTSYRLHRVRGTGLGLYLVTSGVSAIGGRVTYFNAPDGGAVIELVLPNGQAAKGLAQKMV
jgi:signal transduction histidine kinase